MQTVASPVLKNTSMKPSQLCVGAALTAAHLHPAALPVASSNAGVLRKFIGKEIKRQSYFDIKIMLNFIHRLFLYCVSMAF